MTTDLSVLPEYARDVLPETVEPFGEAAWFGWRRDWSERALDIRNGVYWREDGKRVISLAVGTGLHGLGRLDYETYPFVGAAEGMAEDVCCHDSREAADACALIFLVEGRFCSDSPR